VLKFSWDIQLAHGRRGDVKYHPSRQIWALVRSLMGGFKMLLGLFGAYRKAGIGVG